MPTHTSSSARSVAVLGASTDRAKFGNKAVRAFQQQGYTVYPVNPKGGTIEGLPVCASLAEVSAAHLDRISVYLPPPVSFELLPEIAAKGAREIWFNPGSADAQVLAAAREAGLNAIAGCSIVDIGRSPAQFP
ncbi:MAG: CoA-binding protein [Nitrospiraceae bacterium]|nr:CoA-binding protein [Nitrospiraceae bacterium]